MDRGTKLSFSPIPIKMKEFSNIEISIHSHGEFSFILIEDVFTKQIKSRYLHEINKIPPGIDGYFDHQNNWYGIFTTFCVRK